MTYAGQNFSFHWPLTCPRLPGVGNEGSHQKEARLGNGGGQMDKRVLEQS